MPLDEELPLIDDRRFRDIDAEIKSRIVRYTKEWNPTWNDLNDSDPGVTLAQVFAWLSEILIYRLNQVPKLNYVKFLQLLGIELKPATPALTEITFQVSKESTEPFVIVPSRTQVTADVGDGGGPVVFETTRAVVAVKAELTAIQVVKGDGYFLQTDANESAEQGFEPFSAEPDDGNALLLGFHYDGPFPRVDIDLTVWAIENASGTAAYDCGLPETRFYTSADIVWEYSDGAEWSKMEVLKDETMAFVQSGRIVLKSIPEGQIKPDVIGKVEESLYWIRARLDRSRYENPPKILAVRTNTVSAEQAKTIIGEILGGTDGLPNQTLRLESTPVLNGSLELVIDEGSGEEKWTEVEDFLGSSPEHKHFVLNRQSGEVIFGDGVRHGHIPARNVNNPGTNVKANVYRFGGGKKGNAPAGAVNTLLTPLQDIDGSKVTNLKAAHSGRDDETFER
jgi:predicted phage baseplate assembly protein